MTLSPDKRLYRQIDIQPGDLIYRHGSKTAAMSALGPHINMCEKDEYFLVLEAHQGFRSINVKVLAGEKIDYIISSNYTFGTVWTVIRSGEIVEN